MHVLYGGLDLRKIENILITHSHEDHLYPQDFKQREFGYAYFDVDLEDVLPVTVYSSKASGKSTVQIIEQNKLDKCNAFVWSQAKAFCPFKVGEYTVTPLEANHDKKTQPFIYIISKDEKTLLYGNDTGWFPDSTWEYLIKTRTHFDFVSLDCTVILRDGRDNHMGIQCCEDTRERLLEIGAADEKTRFCLHHFSHNGGLIYDELKEVADEKGFLVSYDGAEFEI